MILDNYIEGDFNPMNPANQEERPDEEITISESYYDELIDDANRLRKIKKLFRELFILKNISLEKTENEKLKIHEIENKIKQTLKLR